MAAMAECVAGEVWQGEAVAALERLRLFPDTPNDELACVVAAATEERIPANTTIIDETGNFDDFLVLLEGRCHVSRRDINGNFFFNKSMEAPTHMGEISLLTGQPAPITVITETDTRGFRLDKQSFWEVMARCPHLRLAIQAETMLRMRGMHAHQSQQEKLAMLGTMTAGLMHELNNPGSAARRAASQLRSNLQRMHVLARTFAERGHNAAQRGCLTALQERALSVKADLCMSSLQQADAEEELGEWMDAHGIAKAWEFAPALVSSGIGIAELGCLSGVFDANELSEPIEWLEATASSMQMVGLVEDSVARVVELAQAVKSYAHEGQGGVQDVDVNQSIHATVIMLKHKFREKNIRLVKEFGPAIPKLHCICSGLNQVWTNLLDNAIDAVPTGGSIGVRTALVDGDVQVIIRDNGPGISPEDQDRIFDPFFTTKAAGVGSGMGLGIVRRTLEAYNGRLTLASKPGSTEFTVHIPTTA
jgi:signal transduction histidine kinase